jgi:protocatechuate 3,4-dioxygenase, alpha subunit
MRAPTPSQTVGPFFGFALPFDNDAYAVGESRDAIRVEGQVLDGAGEPVSDALVEASQGDQFARCRTDGEGAFHFTLRKPVLSNGASFSTSQFSRAACCGIS